MCQGEGSNAEHKRVWIDLDMDGTIDDPGLRKPIEDFDSNVRRPCQPT